MATTTDKEAVYRTWGLCTAAYLQHANRKLSLPPDTDPTKTYQWRYLEALTRRIQELALNDQQAKTFIEIAVQYATSHRLLNKGLSIFLQNNLYDVWMEELRRRDATKQGTVGIIARTNAWLRAELDAYRGKSPARAHKTMTDLLLHCETPGGYSNLVRWHQSGQLPEQYLVLSRSCGAALSRVHEDDRRLLPKNSRLFVLRMALLNDSSVKFQLRTLLGDDWRKSV